MARERICVLLAPEATDIDLERMEFALQNLPHPLASERGPGTLLVSVPTGHTAHRVRHDVRRAFAELEIRAFFLPLRTEVWRNNEWVDIGPGPRPSIPSPAPSADRIGWRVRVTPVDAFHWRDLRDEIAWRGRTIIQETEHELIVGAGDEADAEGLARDLRGSPCVRTVACERLSWIARWLVRERTLGNYGDGGPLQP